MGLIERVFKRPGAARISEQIAALENELATAVSAADQAEGRAVDAATSDDAEAYTKAADAAAVAKADVDAKRARLCRLLAAHADAVDREQLEAIEQATRQRDELRTAMGRTGCEVQEAIAAEEKRHAETMAELSRRADAARAAYGQAEGALKRLTDAREAERRSRAPANKVRIDALADELWGIDRDLLAARERLANAEQSAAPKLLEGLKRAKAPDPVTAGQIQQQIAHAETLLAENDEVLRTYPGRIRQLESRSAAVRAELHELGADVRGSEAKPVHGAGGIRVVA